MQDDALVNYDFHCPYCDSPLTFLIDTSQGSSGPSGLSDGRVG